MPIVEPRKTSHLRYEKHPLGEFSRVAFSTERQFPIRCPHCNLLMSADFSLEQKCPNCNAFLTKKEFADASVEAYHRNVVGSGWKREALEDLEGKPSSILHKGKARPIGNTARQMTALGIRQERAALKMIQSLRSGHGILRQRGRGRRIA